MSTKTDRQNAANCPIAEASALIGDMWIILIVRDLLTGPKRFCELQNSLIAHETSQPINTRTLTGRLKMLEDTGILTRTAYAHEMPPKVEYSLTKKGKALSQIIDKVKQYGERYL